MNVERNRDAARTIRVATETPLTKQPRFRRHDDIEAIQLDGMRDPLACCFKFAHDLALERRRDFVHRVEQMDFECHDFSDR